MVVRRAQPVDDECRIEAVHRQFDDLLDCHPRNDLPAPEPKTGKLVLGDKVVDEVVRHAERLGGLGDGENKPFGHADQAASALMEEAILTTHYWCSTPPPLAGSERFRLATAGCPRTLGALVWVVRGSCRACCGDPSGLTGPTARCRFRKAEPTDVSPYGRSAVKGLARAAPSMA